jgi:hypothetical protein
VKVGTRAGPPGTTGTKEERSSPWERGRIVCRASCVLCDPAPLRRASTEYCLPLPISSGWPVARMARDRAGGR